MATVTLYEYDGETRHESGVSVNWRQVGEPVEFEQSKMSFDEALCDGFGGDPNNHIDWCQDWLGGWRIGPGLKAYEAESDDRPLYRAEVRE